MATGQVCELERQMKKLFSSTIPVILLFLTAFAIAQTDGTEKWAFTTANMVNSSPAIGSDSTVYVGSEDKKIYALNSDARKNGHLQREVMSVPPRPSALTVQFM